MRFFNYTVPLSVIKKIVDGLDKRDLQNLSKVNRTWHKMLLQKGEHLSIESEPGIQIDELLPHIQSILPVTPDATIKITHLTAGFSPWASSYRIEIGDQHFVLRKIKHIPGRFSEVFASLYFSAHNIAPVVEYFDYASGIVIMRYISHDPAKLSVIDNAKLQLLAEKFRIIHAAPALKRRDEVEPSTLIAKRRETINAYIQADPVFYLQQYALNQLDILTTHVKQTHYCHNDLNPNNVLATENDIQIIDWECGGVNDPLLDLANTVITLRLKSEDADRLLRKYLKREATDSERFHYICMQQIALLRFSISFAANIANPLNVSGTNVQSIPAFFEYAPSDGKIDKSSDSGKFYISVMLIKQAMKIVNDYHFQADLNHRSHRSSSLDVALSFGSYSLPYNIAAKIFSYICQRELFSLRIVCRSWKLFMNENMISTERKLNAETIRALNPSEDITHRLTHTLRIFLPGNVGEITPLRGGLSPFCSNFILNAYGQKYVVKILENEGIYGPLEMYAARHASRIGIGPRLAYFDPEMRVSVFHFQTNNPRWPADKSLPKLAALVSVVSALHKVEVPEDKRNDAQPKFNQFRDRVRHKVTTDKRFSDFKVVLELHSGLGDLLNQGGVKCLCHSDVSPWNLLYVTDRDQFSLIDWEFAKFGDPIFDLATIANFLRLNLIEETFLRITYAQGRIKPLDEAHYQLAKVHAYLHYAICSLGINSNDAFEIDTEMVRLLPPFNEFNPYTVKIDKNSNLGRYYISQMFVKAAMNLVMNPTFKDYVKTYINGYNLALNPLFIDYLTPEKDSNEKESENRATFSFN